ncbi:uncharacterized protein N0V89_007921 [Didymosphaeria variabile]|uniref:BD-FAE-like domain-containing protein n=1 Tax=Didymosphaeria variabile TaxID=1932322 RepID=A0A9W9CAX4_9PLEO|nr:uncharacterized protein N0V89_007921 [Didymosphaeria variabile]KAJ4352572.1 hypothetical protein N0V89_007921 [Didymosphaeria variabile]
MASNTQTTPSHAAPNTSASIAARGNEITGLDIFRPTTEVITNERVMELMSQMHADIPSSGEDNPYGTYLDSIGSKKIEHFLRAGYAFESANYTLVPHVSVQEQVQEVANAVSYLFQHAENLGFDADRIVLMGHSSGAHVAALLGTDTTYLAKAGVEIDKIKGVITLDASNFNCAAEILDSPGPVADNMLAGLGSDLAHLRDMSPTYHAQAPNARGFLLLQVQRQGDIRQAVEFEAALLAAGTEVEMRVVEGESFEGHIAMLLRLGDDKYAATAVVDEWLAKHVLIE